MLVCRLWTDIQMCCMLYARWVLAQQQMLQFQIWWKHSNLCVKNNPPARQNLNYVVYHKDTGNTFSNISIKWNMDIHEPRSSVRTIVLENLKTPFHIYRWIIQFNQLLILNLISFIETCVPNIFRHLCRFTVQVLLLI